MAFNPYSVWAPRLPQLKPGHIFKIGDKFYQIVVVRRNRQRHVIAGAQTDYRLYTETNAAFATLHGLLSLNRVVHLQYIAVETGAVTTIFYWGTPPLFAKDVALTIDTNVAPTTNPMELDRWSYDTAMHLRLTQSAGQNYIFECVEYEVSPYEGEPDKYLHLMANGQAVFVEK